MTPNPRELMPREACRTGGLPDAARLGRKAAVPCPKDHLPMTLLLVAACALIDADGRVLIAQRPAGKPMAGLWEFPGGKVEAGERPEDTLVRELAEELGVEVTPPCLAPLTFASHAYDDFHLLMPLFVCRRWGGLPRPREGQALKWVRPLKLRDYPMPPADEPLVAHLIDLLA
jgi:8-oxo-dGTP diphosphatase